MASGGQAIEGDWYLHVGDEPLHASTLPRFTFRAERIFSSDQAEHVGLYRVDGDLLKLAISGDEIGTFRLPGLDENTLSGTLLSPAGDDSVISEPALLLRAADQPVPN